MFAQNRRKSCVIVVYFDTEFTSFSCYLNKLLKSDLLDFVVVENVTTAKT